MRTLQERLEKLYIKVDGGCWNWIGCTTNKGYGQIKHDGKMVSAHRVAWTLYVGEIPEGLCVLHKCDNPLCLNPSHLFIGTQKDNMHDCVVKGRHRIPHQTGEGVGTSKLTKKQVILIRKMWVDGVRNGVLAKEFGVHQSTISLITKHENWANI